MACCPIPSSMASSQLLPATCSAGTVTRTRGAGGGIRGGGGRMDGMPEPCGMVCMLHCIGGRIDGFIGRGIEGGGARLGGAAFGSLAGRGGGGGLTGR